MLRKRMVVRLQSAFHASKGHFSPATSNPLKQLFDMLSACRKDRCFKKFNALNVHHMHQDLDKMTDERKTLTLCLRFQWMTNMLDRVTVRKEQSACRECRPIKVSRTR